MNEHQIDGILRRHPHTRRLFRGVFAADELPGTLSPAGGIYVVNLSARHMPGTHWIVAYLNKYKICHYIDTSGEPPKVPSIAASIARSARHLLFNSVRLQSDKSQSCGLFVVLFSIYLARGLGIYDIRLYLVSEPHLLQINEHLVASLLSKEIVSHLAGEWSEKLARAIRRYRSSDQQQAAIVK